MNTSQSYTTYIVFMRSVEKQIHFILLPNYYVFDVDLHDLGRTTKETSCALVVHVYGKNESHFAFSLFLHFHSKQNWIPQSDKLRDSSIFLSLVKCIGDCFFFAFPSRRKFHTLQFHFQEIETTTKIWIPVVDATPFERQLNSVLYPCALKTLDVLWTA